MRTLRVIARRAFGRLWASSTTFFAAACFYALSGGLFAFVLLRGDGGTTPVEALWAVSAMPFLPVLAALLTMRLLADARASGRLELLLAAPVLEREIVLGVYLGVVAMNALVVLGSLVVPLVILPFCAPALAGTVSLLSILPAVCALLMQSLLWCAVGLLASAFFRHAAVAAFASLLLMLALPHAAFELATVWSPILRMKLASMPFEAHIVDFATGLVTLSTFVFYGALTGFALFAATKAVAAVRLRGRGARGLRLSTLFVTALAFVFAGLLAMCALRLDVTFELPLRAGEAKTSARTRQILAETHGDVHVTCFLARRAPEFRAVARLLRGLEATAQAVAGTALSVDYVDPRWELGRAVDLVRTGAEEGTLVFRRGHRRLVVPVADLFAGATNGVVAAGAAGVLQGEAACASAIQRLVLPAQRETVYWTTGHGEIPFDSYDPVGGLSDLARVLRRDGYTLAALDLAAAPAVPDDCAALVVAGAREPFSRVEMARLAGWMQAGGRLLVLATDEPNAGVGALLADLGVKTLPYRIVSPRTLSGADVVARAFADHAVMRPLAGGTAVFGGAVAFAPTPAAQAEGTVYTALVCTDAEAWGETEPAVRPWVRDAANEPAGPFTLVAALERGGDVAKDVALRPMRLVAIGDASFVSNGALARRGNANRDIFLNALAWLSGLDALTASRTPGNAVATGLDRAGWIRFGTYGTALPVGATLLVGLCVFLIRRRGQ